MLASLFKNFSTTVLSGRVLHGNLLHSVLEHGNFCTSLFHKVV